MKRLLIIWFWLVAGSAFGEGNVPIKNLLLASDANGGGFGFTNLIIDADSNTITGLETAWTRVTNTTTNIVTLTSADDHTFYYCTTNAAFIMPTGSVAATFKVQIFWDTTLGSTNWLRVDGTDTLDGETNFMFTHKLNPFTWIEVNELSPSNFFIKGWRHELKWTNSNPYFAF